MKTRPSVKNKTCPVRISQSGNTIFRTLCKMYFFSILMFFICFFLFFARVSRLAYFFRSSSMKQRTIERSTSEQISHSSFLRCGYRALIAGRFQMRTRCNTCCSTVEYSVGKENQKRDNISSIKKITRKLA